MGTLEQCHPLIASLSRAMADLVWRQLGSALVDDLDVVAIRIEHPRGILARIALRGWLTSPYS
jgi:hypothetical protein